MGKDIFEPAFTLRCEELPILPGVNASTLAGRRLLYERFDDLMISDLTALTQRYEIGSDDILILNSLRHIGLNGIIDWLERLGVDRAPTTAVILHYTSQPFPGRADPSESGYRAAFSRIAGSPLRSKFLFFTDSEALAREYRDIVPISIGVLPIPHCAAGVDAVDDVADRPLCFTFAGEARQNKGFHLLPAAVERLRDRIEARRVQFAIQAFSSDPTDKAVNEAVEWLRIPGVTLFEQPVGDKAYESILNSADVLMIPYLQANYHAQTSGIYAEALSLGKPVIVSSGTWMADQVRRYGGGVVFDAEKEQEFALACEYVLQDFNRLKNEAISAAGEWVRFHNGDRFVDLIMDAMRLKGRDFV